MQNKFCGFFTCLVDIKIIKYVIDSKILRNTKISNMNINHFFKML
jgi:hypothetical protein